MAPQRDQVRAFVLLKEQVEAGPDHSTVPHFISSEGLGSQPTKGRHAHRSWQLKESGSHGSRAWTARVSARFWSRP